jgi:hypothetical protein
MVSRLSRRMTPMPKASRIRAEAGQKNCWRSSHWRRRRRRGTLQIRPFFWAEQVTQKNGHVLGSGSRAAALAAVDPRDKAQATVILENSVPPKASWIPWLQVPVLKPGKKLD